MVLALPSALLATDTPTPTPSSSPTPTQSPTPFNTPLCTPVSGEGADWALGQANMDDHDPNRGLSVAQGALFSPQGMLVIGTKLLVADTYNHRVLIWNSLPSSFGAAPDLVLGQPNFDINIPNNGGRAANTLFSPAGLASDGTRLFVADTQNNRVLVFNTVPVANFAAADLVLGQAGFTTGNSSGGSQGLNFPWGLAFDNGKLLVADRFNNRVLGFDGASLATFAAAERVIGQASFSGSSPATSATGLSQPMGVAAQAGRIAVAEYYNHRVSVFLAYPASNGPAADLLIGQDNVMSSTPNFGGLGAQALFNPAGLCFTENGALWIGDSGNHRVLAFDSLPNTSFAAADRVLGQANFLVNAPGGADKGLLAPEAVAHSGSKLFVADKDNNRILIYDCLFNPTPTPSFSASHSPSPTVTPTATLTPPALPLNEALDNYALSFSSNSSPAAGLPWFWQVAESHDGQDALRSGAIGHSAESFVDATVNGAGILDFWWKADSEVCCDFLVLRVDSSATSSLYASVLGWQYQSVTLSAGAHSIQWAFSKDNTVSSGQDRGWLDQVAFLAFTPTPSFTESPTATASPTQSLTPTHSPTSPPTDTPTPVAFKAGAVFSYPNPGVPGERITLVFEPDSSASVSIYDWSLHKVAEIPASQVDAALGRAYFDGRDLQGRALVPGLYFALVQGATRTVKGKLSLLGR